MSINRDIPIKLGDFSVIDTEFSNIRERFDAEMRKMEEEMSKFRSELMNRESNNFFRTSTRYNWKFIAHLSYLEKRCITALNVCLITRKMHHKLEFIVVLNEWANRLCLYTHSVAMETVSSKLNGPIFSWRLISISQFTYIIYLPSALHPIDQKSWY